ncbi:MAG TPA: chloride channel protein [Rhizomicrobium sp.]|nr:chloride channel protein [Rhizomicrobium sp.]
MTLSIRLRALSRLRLRTLRAHSYRWQRRLIFAAGGLIVGLLAVALALCANEAQGLFKQLAARWPYAPLLITPLGFGLAAFMVGRYFPNTQGSGIPQAIAAKDADDPQDRAGLVGPRVAIGKILLTLLGLMVGASTGREGPTVQVGASVMHAMGRLSPRRQPGLIIAGAAAGVAAAFNTPLAGIVFAIEEMSRSFEVRASGLIIGTVILAGLTAQMFSGDYTYFGTSNAVLRIGTAWMAVPLCGVIGGLAGAAFARILVAVPDALPARPRQWIADNSVVFAALCGLGVALCGLASGGSVYGTGYEQARAVLHNTGPMPLYYPPLKFLATALSSVSGVPGGIFSPSLSIGGGIGAMVALLFHHAAPGPIVLLGMVAFFTGVVRAPITGFVIVSEMSGDHSILVALMAAALIAEVCARFISRQGVYHLLSRRFMNVGNGRTAAEH